MGFGRKLWLVLNSSVLLCGSTAWAQTDEATRIIVLVNDSAGVRPDVLKHAENEASRLFCSSGIQVNWIRCGQTSDCRRPPRNDEFVLHIVPNGKTQGDFVFGEAFLDSEGHGKYADVFFDRVRQDADNIDTGQLLGAVAAHELGHLLLGSRAHSLTGIMEPIWRKESLLRVRMGALTFTREQQRTMSSRLVNEQFVATSARRLVP